MKLEKLQDNIGYRFGDRALLLQSLTHTSYGHEKLQKKPIALRDNERLEFLGDAVLDLVISDILLETFPNSREGRLSRMRAAIVNEKTLAEIAKNIGLDQCIRLGKGELLSKGNEKASILSCTFEAIIAGIYLDGGFNAIYPVVRHLFSGFFAEEKDMIAYFDHKTQLQELLQAKKKPTPQYRLSQTTGPDHAKTFEVELKVSGNVLAKGLGASKKEAEQNAAKIAVESLNF